MMGLDNPIHIAFLLIILLLVFGAKRLPELGHSLGTGLRGFKDAVSGDGDISVKAAVQEQSQTTPGLEGSRSHESAAGAPLAGVPVDASRSGDLEDRVA